MQLRSTATTDEGARSEHDYPSLRAENGTACARSISDTAAPRTHLVLQSNAPQTSGRAYIRQPLWVAVGRSATTPLLMLRSTAAAWRDTCVY